MDEVLLRIIFNNTALYIIGAIALIYGIGNYNAKSGVGVLKAVLVACICLLALGTAAAPTSETGVPILTDVWLNVCLALLAVVFFLEDPRGWLGRAKTTAGTWLDKLKKKFNHSD